MAPPVRYRSGFAAVLAATILLAFAFPATAQVDFLQRIFAERIGHIQTGNYVAADDLAFTLDLVDGTYLLRFENTPEVFVLYPDRASLGGREFKYDSGETALHVTGWGGITLYTDDKPGGLPASRTGDSVPPEPVDVTVDEMQTAAQNDAQQLAFVRRAGLTFSADWNEFDSNAGARAFAKDAMDNAARGLVRFAAIPAGRQAIVHRLDKVMLATAAHAAVLLNGRTLVVTFDPAHGYAGRASSRAVARGLGKLFSVRLKKS
jgi:hypothetical protein